MIGAFTLADSLAGDIPAGLRTHEARHRQQRAANENSVAYATRLLIPATSLGIAARNRVTHLMPLASRAAAWWNTASGSFVGSDHDSRQHSAHSEIGR